MTTTYSIDFVNDAIGFVAFPSDESGNSVLLAGDDIESAIADARRLGLMLVDIEE